LETVIGEARAVHRGQATVGSALAHERRSATA
jgi:hypothetical protein